MSNTIIFILAFVIVLFGAALQTGFGFGMGPVVMAFFPLILPYNDSVAFFLMIALMSNIILTIIYFKYINWKVIIPILIPTVIISSFVVLLAITMDATILFIALGFILIFLAVLFIFFNNKIKIKPTILNGSIIGVFCGICNGFFGLAGPFAAFYFLPSLKDKNQYLGTFQVYFLIINLCNVLIRLFKGSISFENYPVIIFGGLGLLLGTLIGYKIFKKLKSKWFEICVYILIGLNGLWIVISNLLSI